MTERQSNKLWHQTWGLFGKNSYTWYPEDEEAMAAIHKSFLYSSPYGWWVYCVLIIVVSVVIVTALYTLFPPHSNPC